MPILWILSLVLGGASHAGASEVTDRRMEVGADSVLTYAGRQYVAQAGVMEDNESEDGLYNVDVTVTDGGVVPLVLPNFVYTFTFPEATVLVYTELYAPGETLFTSGQFVWAEYEDGEASGTPFFTEAYVGIDTNGDGEVDEDEEIPVAGGTVDLSSVGGVYSIQYALELANGETLAGGYTGLEVPED